MLKLLTFSASAFALAAAFPAAELQEQLLVQNVRAEVVPMFSEWKKEHSKVYDSAGEEAQAMSAWAENDVIIAEHNAKNLTWWLGHNEFSDMTWDNFKAVMLPGLFLNRQRNNVLAEFITLPGSKDLADEVDWTSKGAVSEVKNQGQCGSCWAFSTTGSVEGALVAVTGDTLISLSEENLVQCDHVDQGCKGGLMDNGFDYIAQHGIASEASYPYTSGAGVRGTCTPTATVVTLTSHQDVPANNEVALQSAVSLQPVSVAIEADKSVFQLYKGGVFDSEACGTKLDHGVLTVGYGDDSTSGKKFWKVKNSWGATWGEEGYIRMVRGSNMCGIAAQASYPKGVKTHSGPAPPAPTPVPGGKTHYGNPANGCLTDEVDISIQGLSGDFCSPPCGSGCPSDVPSGVTADPACVLRSSTDPTKEYCALECQASMPNQCGEGASCKTIAGNTVSLCTYDE